MGISGRALRQIEASLTIQSMATTPTVTEMPSLPEQGPSTFTHFEKMEPRKYHHPGAFLPGCEFAIGPNGLLVPNS